MPTEFNQSQQYFLYFRVWIQGRHIFKNPTFRYISTNRRPVRLCRVGWLYAVTNQPTRRKSAKSETEFVPPLFSVLLQKAWTNWQLTTAVSPVSRDIRSIFVIWKYKKCNTVKPFIFPEMTAMLSIFMENKIIYVRYYIMWDIRLCEIEATKMKQILQILTRFYNPCLWSLTKFSFPKGIFK